MTASPIAYDAMTTRRIVRTWQRAYREWELGRCSSPSAADLIAEARRLVADFPDDSELLLDVLCEGMGLTSALRVYLRRYADNVNA